jgi:hypothetical protein
MCIKAFCTHFYQDIERQLHARKLPIIKDTPLLIPSDEVGITDCCGADVPTYQLANLKGSVGTGPLLTGSLY